MKNFSDSPETALCPANRGKPSRLLIAAIAIAGFGMFRAPPLQAEDLGRLFLTPEQRAELERLRNGIVETPPVVVPPPVVEQPPAVVQSDLPPPVPELGAEHILPIAPPPAVPPITVNGVVLRSNGQGTAWVNGQNTSDGDFSADNIRVERPRSKVVQLRTPENLPDVRLKPGQTYNPATNTIVEPYDVTN
ncbi:MAG: hypothetical protein U1F34_00605 [Gammaproteobacteria bacterium]